MLKIRAKEITNPYMDSDEEILLGSTVPKLLEYWSAFNFSAIAGPKKIYGSHEEVCVFHKKQIWNFKEARIALTSPKDKESKYHRYVMIFSSVHRTTEEDAKDKDKSGI